MLLRARGARERFSFVRIKKGGVGNVHVDSVFRVVGGTV
jgi:hypothetical protein